MAVKGFQDLWITGSRLYVQRKPIGLVEQPILDLGVIEPVAPQISATKATLYDSDGGVRSKFAEATTQIDETYQATCSNLNNDNLALFFMGLPPEDVTIASTEVTGTYAHTVQKGRLVKVRDNTGGYVWGITSIAAVKTTDGTPVTLVLGTDYDIVSLERGLIRIRETTTVVEDGDTVTIDYTPRAITGKRVFYPQSATNIEANVLLVYGRDNNKSQSVREAECSIAPANGSFDSSNYSNIQLTFSVLSDLTKEHPAGRFFHWLGELPSAS